VFTDVAIAAVDRAERVSSACGSPPRRSAPVVPIPHNSSHVAAHRAAKVFSRLVPASIARWIASAMRRMAQNFFDIGSWRRTMGISIVLVVSLQQI
jgi:hypothetical protein